MDEGVITIKILKKFLFWLPFLSLVLIVFEIIVQPIKHIWMAIDPIYAYLYLVLLEDFHSLTYALILHFILAIIYGFVLDRFIEKLRTNPNKS